MVAILGAMLHKVTYLKTLPCWKSDISWEAYFPKKQVGSLLAENMKLGMMVYFDLLSHFGNFGACTDHLVAAKCSIFDEILLQIAISQKLLEGFG